eukprot:129515-Hanusia_phi.AAC.1
MPWGQEQAAFPSALRVTSAGTVLVIAGTELLVGREGLMAGEEEAVTQMRDAFPFCYNFLRAQTAKRAKSLLSLLAAAEQVKFAMETFEERGRASFDESLVAESWWHVWGESWSVTRNGANPPPSFFLVHRFK